MQEGAEAGSGRRWGGPGGQARGGGQGQSGDAVAVVVPPRELIEGGRGRGTAAAGTTMAPNEGGRGRGGGKAEFD